MISFMTPWMLAGLAAVGLPVLVHFLTRPRPRTIRYPTVHLLVEAGSGRQALNRLRTWIILALRTLAVTALVLLFARPFVKAPGAVAEPGEARRVVLLVDASMSMRAVEGGVPLFAKGRAQAADLLWNLEEGSAAGVIFIGAKPQPVLPALSRNLATLREELVSAEATLEKGDPAAAIALAERMLEGTGTVYVFSDFQRTDWAGVDFARHPNLAFFLRPVVETPVQNVGITAIGKSPGEPVEDETIELVVTVFNASPTGRQAHVALDLEGVPHAAKVTLRPYASSRASFSFSLPTAGVRAGKVTLEDDDLPADNVRYFKLRVRRALRVAVISDADVNDTASGAFFVAKALRPSAASDTGLEVVQRLTAEVDRNALETSDAFFLVSPTRLGGETAEIIARRVTGGAHLVCFLDGPTAPPTVGALRAASEGGVSPPFALLQPVHSADAADEVLGETVTHHGPLRLFHSPTEGDLKGLRFYRHIHTEDDAARSNEVLMRFADRSAALTLSPAGRGTVVFANFTVAPGGSNLAGSPLFPALLHELMRAMRRTDDDDANTPGRDWHIDVVTDDTGEGDMHVTAPDGSDLDATVVSRGRALRLALAAVHDVGHYVVDIGGTRADVGVVNVDPRETDTRSMSVPDLVEPVEGGRSAVAVLTDEGDLLTAGKPRALWPYLAAFAALMLATEMLLLSLWRRNPQRAALRQLRGRAS